MRLVYCLRMITPNRAGIKCALSESSTYVRRVLLCTFTSLFFIVVSLGRSAAKPGTLNKQYDAGAGKVDVVLFVMAGSNGAELAIAYNSRVTRTQVQHDVQTLFEDAHWTPGSYLQVSDASANPSNPREFPVTTAAQILALNAPQYVNGYPQVMPYLRAFQRFNHIEIDFTTPNRTLLVPSFHVIFKALTAVVSVAQGTLRYDVVIHDHKGPLPDISAVTRVSQPVMRPIKRNATSQRSLLVAAAVILAIVLVTGVVLLIIARKRMRPSVRAPSGRN